MGLRYPLVEETDLYDDEILVKGRRWGGLSEFQDSILRCFFGSKTNKYHQISGAGRGHGRAPVFDIDLYGAWSQGRISEMSRWYFQGQISQGR